jgi:hypothetical protein
MDVAIVGGGIIGLVLALGLINSRFQVQLPYCNVRCIFVQGRPSVSKIIILSHNPKILLQIISSITNPTQFHPS